MMTQPQESVTGGGKYLLYTFLGRPVFAVPANPRRLRRAALHRLQPSTVKRAVYRTCVGWSMLARGDWLFSQSVGSPLEQTSGSTFDWENWLHEMREYFGITHLAAAFFWPTVSGRGRLYAHVFDGTEPVGFAKISLGANSSVRLSREAETLRRLGAKYLQAFRVPRLLMEGKAGEHLFLLLEPVPTSARPIARRVEAYPHESVKEYSDEVRSIGPDMVPTLSWWAKYIGQTDRQSQQFHDELISLLDVGTTVCRVHGDLSPHNVVWDERTLWIYDWEESAPDAPVRSDPIGFALSIRQSAIRSSPVLETGRFKRRYLKNVKVADRLEIMMALAFRHAAGIDDATQIIRNWSSSK